MSEDEKLVVFPANVDKDPIYGTVGMRGKLGLVTIHVHASGVRRIYKDGMLIGEYENAVLANDFARQQSGFGYYKGE